LATTTVPRHSAAAEIGRLFDSPEIGALIAWGMSGSRRLALNSRAQSPWWPPLRRTWPGALRPLRRAPAWGGQPLRSKSKSTPRGRRSPSPTGFSPATPMPIIAGEAALGVRACRLRPAAGAAVPGEGWRGAAEQAPAILGLETAGARRAAPTRSPASSARSASASGHRSVPRIWDKISAALLPNPTCEPIRG
jgi:hypothetical protein